MVLLDEKYHTEAALYENAIITERNMTTSKHHFDKTEIQYDSVLYQARQWKHSVAISCSPICVSQIL